MCYLQDAISQHCSTDVGFIHQCYLRDTMPRHWSPDVVCSKLLLTGRLVTPLVTTRFTAGATKLSWCFFYPQAFLSDNPPCFFYHGFPWASSLTSKLSGLRAVAQNTVWAQMLV